MGSRTNWSYEETSLLLALWSEESVQKELGGTYKIKRVFGGIAEKMREHGYERTPEQCVTRVKTLRIAYNACKANNMKSGAKLKRCPFYTELDAVLGHRPIVAPSVLLETDAGFLNDDGDSSTSSLDESMETSNDESVDTASKEESSLSTETDVQRTNKLKSSSSKGKKTKSTIPDLMAAMIQSQKEARRDFMEMERERMRLEMEAEERRHKAELDANKLIMMNFAQMMSGAFPYHRQHQTGDAFLYQPQQTMYQPSTSQQSYVQDNEKTFLEL